MSNYTVTWTIDIEADSAREAAEKAREHQIAEGTTAVVFHVWHDGVGIDIDLLDPA